MSAITDEILPDLALTPQHVIEPPNVSGLPEGFRPLTDVEFRDLYRKVNDLHEWIGELREVKDRLPEMMENMPPMMKMMLSGLFK